ncbi:hypothetical protein [Xenorhabdus sp. SGI240]|uniref:hypothetical protein n=1 Tax=Xenorhabdus sp. SGI240 TaxID=3158262 RepID=UPI0032B7D20E
MKVDSKAILLTRQQMDALRQIQRENTAAPPFTKSPVSWSTRLYHRQEDNNGNLQYVEFV